MEQLCPQHISDRKATTHTWRFNHWQKGDWCCNLSNYALNLLLHFSFILLLAGRITNSTEKHNTQNVSCHVDYWTIMGQQDVGNSISIPLYFPCTWPNDVDACQPSRLCTTPETEICHANADGIQGRRRQGEATLAESTKVPEKPLALQCVLPPAACRI